MSTLLADVMHSVADPVPADFAVAIPTYCRGEHLCRVIEDVLAQSPAPREILVIDQTPQHEPEVQERLAAWAADGTIRLFTQRSPSLPHARNRALDETICPIVVFLDDDVRLHPGCLAAHLRHYADPAVQGVTGRVKQPTDTPWRRMRRRGGDDAYLDFDFSAPGARRGVQRFSGCNHSVRVAFLKKLGGYDEHITGSGLGLCEDLDAGLRVARAGGVIIYEPEAALDHLLAPMGGSRTLTGRPEDRIMEERMYSSLYFVTKNFFPRPHFWSRVLGRYPRWYVVNRATWTRPGWMLRLAGLYLRAFRRAWRDAHNQRQAQSQAQEQAQEQAQA